MSTVLIRPFAVAVALLLALGLATGSLAHDDPTKGTAPDGDHDKNHSVPEHGSLAEVGAKLSNPVSDVWALFTQFNMIFSDGNVNTGNPKVAASILFQPILPIPLYGSGIESGRATGPRCSRSSFESEHGADQRTATADWL